MTVTTPETTRPADATPPGIKLEGQVSPDAPDEQFRFVRQMGLRYVSTSVPPNERPRFERGGPGSAAPDYEYLARARERFDHHGLSIYNWGDWRSESVLLGLPDRDEVIESYARFLWALGRVGIPCSTYAHWPVIPELFRTFAGYERALAIADSPNVGVCLCTGCWLEGGDTTGTPVVQAALAFGAAGKLFHVHFRNVSAPLPHFVETFVDDGYMDMYRVMRALRAVEYRGGVSPDHIPLMAGDRRVGQAFTLGYMKAMLQRADEEVGVPGGDARAAAPRA